MRCFLDALVLARKIVDVLEEKKAEDIVLLDLREIVPFADFFVICSGSSNRMLQALADAVKTELKQEFGVLTKLEGGSHSGWVLADLGDVIVHIFSPEQRDFYDLEGLWSEGKVILHLQ